MPVTENATKNLLCGPYIVRIVVAIKRADLHGNSIGISYGISIAPLIQSLVALPWAIVIVFNLPTNRNYA